jgi:hypothetical protein
MTLPRPRKCPNADLVPSEIIARSEDVGTGQKSPCRDAPSDGELAPIDEIGPGFTVLRMASSWRLSNR